MPNIYLGPSGSEVLIPVLTGKGGAIADTPVRLDKQAQESVQSDGSRRFGVVATKRQWSFSWELLTAAEKQTIHTLYNLTQALRLQDNFEGTTWYTVFFQAFSFSELRSLSSDTNKYYSVAITLVEI